MGQFMRNTKKRPLRKSRIDRVCDLCHDAIKKGQLYSKTYRGTTYCQKCDED